MIKNECFPRAIPLQTGQQTTQLALQQTLYSSRDPPILLPVGVAPQQPNTQQLACFTWTVFKFLTKTKSVPGYQVNHKLEHSTNPVEYQKQRLQSKGRFHCILRVKLNHLSRSISSHPIYQTLMQAPSTSPCLCNQAMTCLQDKILQSLLSPSWSVQETLSKFPGRYSAGRLNPRGPWGHMHRISNSPHRICPKMSSPHHRTHRQWGGYESPMCCFLPTKTSSQGVSLQSWSCCPHPLGLTSTPSANGYALRSLVTAIAPNPSPAQSAIYSANYRGNCPHLGSKEKHRCSRNWAPRIIVTKRNPMRWEIYFCIKFPQQFSSTTFLWMVCHGPFLKHTYLTGIHSRSWRGIISLSCAFGTIGAAAGRDPLGVLPRYNFW